MAAHQPEPGLRDIVVMLTGIKQDMTQFNCSLNSRLDTLTKNVETIDLKIGNINERMELCENRMGALEDNVDDEFTNMKRIVETQNKVIAEQQRFLEMLDSRERANNLVLIGVNENESVLDETTDNGKVESIMAVCGVPRGNQAKYRLKRIGKSGGRGIRPILMTFNDADLRKTALENRLNLRPEPTSRIFIKKDTHPMVRREWKRLYDAKKAAKDRPENTGKDVHIRDGKLYVNQDVIDEFHKPGWSDSFRQ